jgi:hypothetical protein
MGCSCYGPSCTGAPIGGTSCGAGTPFDYTCASNQSGTTPILPANASTTGGVINTAQNPLPAPDAGGGNGTYPSVLQQTMTQGLNDALVSATEFGLGALNDRLAVAAYGHVQPAAAQSPARGIGVSLSPTALLVIGAIIVIAVLASAK